MARKSGSLNLKGMLDTWRRFGWDLESVVVEDVVVVPVGMPLVGDEDNTAVTSDTLVWTPDVDVAVDNLASALALTLSASEFSENSLRKVKVKFHDTWQCFVCRLTLSWSLLLLAVVDTERGNDVLMVVTGCDTIELNSVDVVCEWEANLLFRNSQKLSSNFAYVSGADVWLLLLLSICIRFEWHKRIVNCIFDSHGDW